MHVINDESIRVPIKIWTNPEKVEPEALQQLKNVASLPFVFKHVAVMPDVHYGKGATIGSVIATKNAIIPAAVGVDIGCGMCAMKLRVDPEIILEKADKIRNAIERSVPVGFNQHKKCVAEAFIDCPETFLRNLSIVPDLTFHDFNQLYNKATLQCGTLGGGNHFIELCQDSTGAIWVMLHSGSRGIGKIIADIHIDTAKADMKKMFIDLPDPDLAYFVKDTPEMYYYLQDLQWAQKYAALNRKTILDLILKEISYYVNGKDGGLVDHDMYVNCHHNYVEIENHFNENVFVTRKGAIRARKDELGIIPGSMGAKSFIVRGLGNPESFNSCAHGAGRLMSRNKARKTFTVEDLKQQTEGVNCRKDDGVLDEIPGAYKNIGDVMVEQADLVEIVAQLKQFICIKG